MNFRIFGSEAEAAQVAEERAGASEAVSSLPTIDQLQKGAKRVEDVSSSNGSNGQASDVIHRQYLIVMRHGERADEVR